MQRRLHTHDSAGSGVLRTTATGDDQSVSGMRTREHVDPGDALADHVEIELLLRLDDLDLGAGDGVWLRMATAVPHRYCNGVERHVEKRWPKPEHVVRALRPLVEAVGVDKDRQRPRHT